MQQPHSAVAYNLIAAARTLAIMSCSVLSGTITRFDLHSTTTNAADCVFDVKVNGVSLWAGSPSSRPKILAGTHGVSVTGLSQAVVIGDEITVEAVTIPAGGIGAILGIIVGIDDGTSASLGHPIDTSGQEQSGSFFRLDMLNVKYILEDESILTSTLVTQFYQGALARNPSSGEMTTQKGLLDTARNTSALSFITAMKNLGSLVFDQTAGSEYVLRGRTDSQFVTDLYTAYLNRPPDGAFSSWVALVASTGRTSVRNGFRDSDEFYRRRIVRGYWHSITGMDAASLVGQSITGSVGAGKTLVDDGAGHFNLQLPATTHSVPAGGSTAQALVKISNADYDYGWGTVSGGSGTTTFIQDIIALAPEFYFRLGEASGAFADSSGHSTVATLNGSGSTRAVTGLLSGDTDKALQVAGAADLSIPTASRFQPAVLTLMALFKPTATAAASPLITSNHTDYWSNGRGFHLTIDAAGKAHVIIDQGGAAFVHCVGTTVTQAGSTYLIAATFDGETVNVYVNGVLEASTDFPHNISWANQTDIRIASNQQAGGGPVIFANGVVDEAIWINTALSAAQIRSLAIKALGEATPDPFLDLDEIDGFWPVRVDGSNITVGRGACFIPSLRSIKRLDAPMNLSVSSLSASTWYYVYAYWASGRLQFEYSTTAPFIYDVNGAIKPGDEGKRFTGIVFLTTSGGTVSDFWAYSDSKHEIVYVWKELTNTGIWRLANSGNPGNGSPSGQISLTAVVPDIVYKKWRFQANANVGAGDVLNLGIHGESTIPFNAWYCAEYGSRIDLRNGSASATGQMPAWGEIHLQNGRQFMYIIGYVTTGSVTIDAKGFSVRR